MDNEIQTRTFQKPRVVLSRCIELCHCRYDGGVVKSPVVRRLADFVDFIPVCPEVGIRLGIPREPVRIVRRNGTDRLVQPATGKDLTSEMLSFCASFLDGLPDVDGFILKSRSPSSGLYDVRIYPAAETRIPTGTGAGFFGGAVLQRFPLLPAEDDERLRDPWLLEHFLTRVFTLADWRQVRSQPSVRRLFRFHSQNQLLLMAHDPETTKNLERIITSDPGCEVARAVGSYEKLLLSALSRVPPTVSEVDILRHAFGHVSGELSAAERQHFFSELDRYRKGTIPSVSLKNLLKTWITRSGTTALAEQTFFAPFPDSLAGPGTPETEREGRSWG